jgi:hypothetical protein
MERGDRRERIDREEFKGIPDYSLIQKIIDRGNIGEGYFIMLDDSAYSRLKKLKAGDTCVITINIFNTPPIDADLEYLARKDPKHYSNKKLLRMTLTELDLVREQTPYILRYITGISLAEKNKTIL